MELLEFVGMHRFADAQAGALSYGQRSSSSSRRC